MIAQTIATLVMLLSGLTPADGSRPDSDCGFNPNMPNLTVAVAQEASRMKTEAEIIRMNPNVAIGARHR